MSRPAVIDAYLAAFNASLEVGLRSRRRILAEVDEHLYQAAQEHVRDGASPDDALQRAITAFGSPQEVAAHFDAGLVGTLDRRLALGARRLHRWTTRRPWRIVAIWMALMLLLAAVFGGLAAIFGGSKPQHAAAWFVSMGAVMSLLVLLMPSYRRQYQRLPTDARWTARFHITGLFAYPSICASLGASGAVPFATWDWLVYFTLACASWHVLTWKIDRTVDGAARGYPGGSDEERARQWCADHPLRGALADVIPLPLALVVLVVTHPGPMDVRVALIVLIVAITALAAAIVRLEQATREQDAYQRAYMSDAT